MNLINFYYALPYTMRVFLASCRGYQLRWLRYGRRAEARTQTALERDRWSATRWKSWQKERLAMKLHHAATTVPFYRNHWSKRRRRGDRASWEVIENWPILSKEDIRQYPKAFLSERAPKKLIREQTSGTTGTPLTIWFSKEAIQIWYALVEARWRIWYGISKQDRWANIGVQPVVPFEQTEPPFWVWNAGLNQLYLSSVHFKPDNLVYFVEALRDYCVQYLYGYSSCLYWIALYTKEHELPFHRLKAVLSCAEPIYDYQRKIMEDAFRSPVKETFGQSEKICAASECEYGSLHLWPEVGYSECLDETGEPVGLGESGRLIGTSLMNDAMPLIRYDTLDMVQRPESDSACRCGRGLPILGNVQGRYNDSILTADGRRIGQVDAIFGGNLRMKEAQIIQESLNKFIINVVPAEGWDHEDELSLSNALRRRVGAVEIEIVTLSKIERTWSGKFRTVVSKME